MGKVKARVEWEHFSGDPQTLEQRGKKWFAPNGREVVVVAGDLPVKDPTTLQPYAGYFDWLNPESKQKHIVFLVYADTY